jgi:hypothetical protein
MKSTIIFFYEPFTIAPLSDNVDWAASTPESEDILASAYDTSNLDHLGQAILKECQYKTTADSITGHVTTEEFWVNFEHGKTPRQHLRLADIWDFAKPSQLALAQKIWTTTKSLKPSAPP